jgi:hypothetical protein
MLAHDGVVFAEAHFFRGIARVFLGYIEKASVSCAEQFDFDSGWLRHNPFLLFESKMMRGASKRPRECAANAGLGAISQVALRSHIPAIAAVYHILTMLADTHIWGSFIRGRQMNFDQDRLLLARAQLSDLLDVLRVTNFDSNPVQFLMRLDAVRHTAMDHRFEAVAEIASHFEESMQRVMGSGHSDMVVRGYTEILDEAIGCGVMGVEIAQGLLASVAQRLHT